MLTLDSVAKRFGARTLLERVSLEVAAGEFVAIMGESGMGKSTLLNVIAGLEPVDAGSDAVHGPGSDPRWTTTRSRACAGIASASSSRRSMCCRI